MPHRERQVEEEGLAGRFLPLHEVDRLRHQFSVDLGPDFPRERLDRAQRTARDGLDDLRPLRQQLVGRRVHRVRQRDRVDVGRRVPGDVGRNAIELIEAVRRRQALRFDAEVPLAEDGRGIAGVLEQLTHRDRAFGQRALAAGHDDQRQAVADRVLPRHQRRARRCAAGLDQILRQAQTLTRQLVDARRRCAAQLAAAVGTEVAVADVVGEDEDDVGFLGVGGLRDGGYERQRARNAAARRFGESLVFIVFLSYSLVNSRAAQPGQPACFTIEPMVSCPSATRC